MSALTDSLKFVPKTLNSALGFVNKNLSNALNFTKKSFQNLSANLQSGEPKGMYSGFAGGMALQAGIQPEEIEKNKPVGRLATAGVIASAAFPSKGIGMISEGLPGARILSNVIKKAPQVFEGFTDLSTKLLEKLKGRIEVSKQFISDLTNAPDLKQVEKDIIRNVLETHYPESTGRSVPTGKKFSFWRSEGRSGESGEGGFWFDAQKGGFGEEIALEEGIPYKKYDVFLENPLKVEDNFDAINKLWKEKKPEGTVENLYKEFVKDRAEQGDKNWNYHDIEDFLDAGDEVYFDSAIAKRAKELGYDGVIYEKRGTVGGEVQVFDGSKFDIAGSSKKIESTLENGILPSTNSDVNGVYHFSNKQGAFDTASENNSNVIEFVLPKTEHNKIKPDEMMRDFLNSDDEWDVLQNAPADQIWKHGTAAYEGTVNPEWISKVYDSRGNIVFTNLEAKVDKTGKKLFHVSEFGVGRVEQTKIPVQDFANKVKAELLPLELNKPVVKVPNFVKQRGQEAVNQYVEEMDMPLRYENISLPDEVRGNVANYDEHIWQSPIKTSVGQTHFNDRYAENYFGHTRVEDMADKQTRRVIEVQSDLYQKGNLEKEMPSNLKDYTPDNKSWAKEFALRNDLTFNKERIPLAAKRQAEIQKLQQYNDPTAHFRMVREEVKQAAIDGKTKLQFPTGETIMKIEQLGGREQGSFIFRNKNGNMEELVPGQLNISKLIEDNRTGDEWIITDVLGDGKFKAVPKDKLEDALSGSDLKIKDIGNDELGQFVEGFDEQFDISGKVDTNNPVYKFYEKDLGRYLKSKYGATNVIDKQGISWMEINVKPEMAKSPIEAFGIAGLLGLGQSEKEKAARADTIVHNMQIQKMHEDSVNKFKSQGSIIKQPQKIDTTEVKSKDTTLDDKQLKIVATVIAEAIGEGEQGMQAVFNVMNNRAEKNKTEIFDEVAKPYQFSAFSTNNRLYVKIRDYLRGKDVTLTKTEKIAVDKITEMVKNGVEDITGGATHYANMATSTDRSWFDKIPKTGQIGKHTFFK